MVESTLIIGGRGFIGGHLVDAFAARGRRVVAVVPEAPANDAQPGVSYASVPLSAAGFSALLRGCGGVIHAASRTTPGDSAGRALAEVQANLVPLMHLLEALQENPVPLLYLSSGGALYDAKPGPGANEGDPCRPRSYYGAGKLAAEYFIQAWANQSRGAATLVRPSNVYGPGQSARNGFAIVPTAMQRILQGDALAIWGDGSARRDYLYIDDLVELCIRIISRTMPAGARVINAASGRSMALSDLLTIIETVSAGRLIRRFEPTRPVDAPCIAIDPSLAFREYGWQASTPLEVGLLRTWQWFCNSAG